MHSTRTTLSNRARVGTVVALGLVITGWAATSRHVTAGARADGPSPASTGVQAASPAAADAAARGKYLVTAMGCTDCHTPFKVVDGVPAPDETRLLSGHPADMDMSAQPALTEKWSVSFTGTNTAWAGPWGTSYTANLTPDPETGTGSWSAQQFVDTVRNGRHLGNERPLLPPMPWMMFRNLTDEDLKAIFAYLRTIPAIRNKVPEPRMSDGPAPSISMDDLERRRREVAPGANSNDPVARGAYLVTAFDCSGCHTPIKADFSPDVERALSGHPADMAMPAPPAVSGPWVQFASGAGSAWAGPWGTSFTANITSDPDTGIGAWTEQQFVDTLRNGRHQGRGRELLPPMPWPGYATMTDADLKAMFAYLRTVKPVRNRVPDAVPPGSGSR